jgi:hypothetical protein
MKEFKLGHYRDIGELRLAIGSKIHSGGDHFHLGSVQEQHG